MKSFILAFLVAIPVSSFALSSLKDLQGEQLKAELNRMTGEKYNSLTYKEARIKLFNVVFLEKDEKGYFNLDPYCQQKLYRKFKDDVVTNEIPDHNLMNTEHTWPQSRFNETLNEEVQKTDLHHLFPTFSKINAQRGNYQFGNVGTSANIKLFCDKSKLGKPVGGVGGGTFFEPPLEHKGNVARALFYFSVRYNTPIEPLEEIFLKYWHLIDPVDELEKERHEVIFGIQLNRNPFIDNPELVLNIADF